MGKTSAQMPIGFPMAYETDAKSSQQEIVGLRELRQLAGKAQVDIASALNIKQPSVSKVEKRAGMYLSTLRNYVDAIDGELVLTVKRPTRPLLRLHHLVDISSVSATKTAIPQKNGPSSSRSHYG